MEFFSHAALALLWLSLKFYHGEFLSHYQKYANQISTKVYNLGYVASNQYSSKVASSLKEMPQRVLQISWSNEGDVENYNQDKIVASNQKVIIGKLNKTSNDLFRHSSNVSSNNLTGLSERNTSNSSELDIKMIENLWLLDSDSDDSLTYDLLNFFKAEEAEEEIKKKVVQESEKQKKSQLVKKTFSIEDDDFVLGNPKSPVVVIEYTSFTCAHCAYYHTNVQKKIKNHYVDSGKVAYVIRNIVFSKQDLDSTILARCDKEKFEAFSNVLYSRQRTWVFARNYRDILRDIGQLGGISPQMYNQCLNDKEIKEQLLLKTKKFAEALDTALIPTPTIIVNGMVVSRHSFEDISTEIEKNLKNISANIK